jgi:hypothetical protein
MYTKLIWLFCFVIVLSVAGNVSADLVGYWKFDEGSGNKAYDSSGYGNDGTIYGIPHWVAGQVGTALYFDGYRSSVEIPHSESLSITEQITIEAWTNMTTGSGGSSLIVSKGMSYLLWELNGGRITWFAAGIEGCSFDSPPASEWHHIAATFDGTMYKCYIDGELSDENDWGSVRTIPENELPVYIGGQVGSDGSFDGMIDEVKIYNHALSGEDIHKIVRDLGGFRKAAKPDPADGAFNSNLWVALSWQAGEFAVSHDVYIGDNYDDVTNGTGDTFRGNLELNTTFFIAGIPGYAYPDGLVPGTTYYWRVDEVNDAEPDSPWKGDVWSFTVPSKTADNPDPADGAEFVDLDAILSWIPGYDAELHTVYIGNDFDDVNDATGSVSQDSTTYNPGMLELGTVYYWRVDENDGLNTYKGDIWSFTTSDFMVVDDFEDYDIGNNEIWWSWKDGLGYAAHGNEPVYPGNGTGSAVGDETTWSFTEETIVHSGKQSMPMFYDNNKQGYSYYSQAELTLDYPRDWTGQDVNNLIIWFRGIASNDAERLYVSLSNKTGAAVVIYYDDPAATQIDTWTEWAILLQDFADQGIDLTDVNTIAIGVGTQGNITTPGGTGEIYIDDIRLYRSEIDAVE